MSKDNIFNLVIFLVIVAIGGWLGVNFYKAYQPKEHFLQGQIEAREYAISSKVAGRVGRVFVKKGDMVKKGDKIFSIISPELNAKIDQAKAGQLAADALYKEAKEGARKEQIRAAKEEWKKALSAYELYKKTYDRVHALYLEGVMSKQKNDEAYTQFQTYKYTKNAAYEVYKMALRGTREQTKLAASAKASAAKSAVKEVEAYAKDLNIVSLYDGEVDNILLYSGELSPSGFPVVNIVDMNDSWVVLHVREDELKKFQKGSHFYAQIPALNLKKVKFVVTYISVMGTFASWRATNSEDGFDMRTFEVEATPENAIKNLRVGMSVLVKR